MSIVSLSALAVAAVVTILFLKPKNGEIALMLGLAASAAVFVSLLGSAQGIILQVNSIVAASGVNTGYIVILLKVVGICMITEFAVNTCNDAGSRSLAGSVSLAGKLMATAAALPLYTDIMKTVTGILN
ncbi:MAG: SpoIIIAC/SpoIIIAD family protein [Ruminococcus sp.]|nr:SpoIIIAC/SpoIIIAD family protein [Ruminococcus sp.]